MRIKELGESIRPWKRKAEISEEDESSEHKNIYYYFKTSDGGFYKVLFWYYGLWPADLVEEFNGEPAEGEQYVTPLMDLHKYLEESDASQVPISSYIITFARTTGEEENEEEESFNILNLGPRVGLEVFATVQECMLNFLETYYDQFDALEFSAKEPSRQKLYDRFSKMIEKHLGFYLMAGETAYRSKAYILFDPSILLDDDDEDDEDED